MRVPLLDLTRQNREVAPAIAPRVQAVFDSQQFILGSTVSDFEAAFCAAFGCAHAVGMSSGTDAQLAILMALGIGRGDAVITTPYTFFATAGCIERTGAEPVFVDILPDTLHMDPARLRDFLLSECRTDADGHLCSPRGNRLRAVIPIHLFGSVCRMEEISSIASEFGLHVMEDAAQAVGAEYPSASGPQNAGCIGDSAYFSFFPTKNLGGAGDGGMAVCKDAGFAEKLRSVRNHGMTRTYHHEVVGGNFRLDALQAAVLHAKLPFLDGWNDRRRTNAKLYKEAFQALLPGGEVELPAEPHAASGLKGHHTFHQYVIRAQKRDALKSHLAEAGIGHAIYYPLPLHLQPCFAHLGHTPGDFPEAELAAKDSLALPIFPELEPAEISAVAEAIAAFYKS